MTEREILEMYRRAGALLDGHFILSSGRHSNRYLQSALVLMDLAQAERLAAALIERLPGRAFDCVVAPAIGGLVIGQEVARQLRRPYLFTERKGGVMQLRRGFSIPRGARVLIVEDVVTTGGSVRECAQVIEQAGGVVAQIAALVDRDPDASGRFDAPFLALLPMRVESWPADECPLCRDPAAPPPVKPGSRGEAK